jgi:tRNA threonylcarbamoyladenosine modification (KEOPS) complex Cgi121 subunit
MTWEEVRKGFPNRFVKLQILKSHIEKNRRHIDDMAVIKAFDDEKEATRELVRSKDDILVYHTGKEQIEVEIKDIFGYRGAI